MDCHHYRALMHECLDEDISEDRKAELHQHIEECEACRMEFEQLHKTELLLKGQAPIKAPDDFTLKVMSQLPKEKPKDRITQWMKRHPIAVAAAVFIILMAGTSFTIGEDGKVYLTSTAHIEEQLAAVETFFRWLWHTVQEWFK